MPPLSELLPLWRLQTFRRVWRDYTRLQSFRRGWRDLKVRATFLAVRLLRRFRSDVTFIGVTGSAGKTTAKELIIELLASEWQGQGTRNSRNRAIGVARSLWRISRSDRFFVCEVSAGEMDATLPMLRPQVGVVIAVGDDHWRLYGSREGIALEKGKLIAALPDNGVAVLNADDPLVLSMRERCRGRVVTFGHAEDADVRATQVRSVWPDRLSCTVSAAGEQAELKTQLCGTHLVYPVLAAIAAGLSLGFSLQKCARAIAAIPPPRARMEPLITADGVTFIRDDFKAPAWTLPASLQFMAQARAPRKVIVIGMISDYHGASAHQYTKVARQALDVADHVVFVGPWSSGALAAARGRSGGSLFAFSTVQAAASHLNSMLRSGDLVLLKGTMRMDHLYRIVLSRTGSIQCWRDNCGRQQFCENCPDLSVPSGRAGIQAEAIVPARGAGARSSPTESGVVYIVGLGNPGERYAGTPHNVGHDVVDRLSRTLKADWVEHEQALVATQIWKDREICLVKLRVLINRSGPAIRTLAARLGFDADDLVLVHDDLDLPLGTVRTRMRGSAGGHKGVASVIDAFQTDAIRRVKLGIRPSQQDIQAIDYVLRPFTAEDRPAVDELCAAAEKRILDLIQQRKPTGQNDRRGGLDTEAQAHSR